MATTTSSAIDSSSNPKSVDASLWWDSFSALLTDLEQLSLSSSDLPPSLAKKLKDNHGWFLNTVSLFKPPNSKSREALNSQQVNIGSHQLTIKPQFKDAALRISDSLFLDEVQSYILVKKVVDQNDVHVDFITQDFLHMVLLQYYIERQCLLKCTRQIITHALYVGIDSKEGIAIREEALKLVSEGLESRLLSVLQNLLSATYPEQMDVDLFTLWAEETLIEDSLVLDILFLAYYESLCTCTGDQWKKLCSLYKEMVFGSFNFGRLAISEEAMHSIYHAKVQLLLILVETLNLENILLMIHDETPFSQGFGAFSLTDVQEMDAIISSLNAFETKEAGPLVLTWAVFLCLIMSLPGKSDSNVLMEIDHIGYVRQAFEAESLSYFLEILQSDILKNSDGPVAGYRGVLRTFISGFIASYEISLQLEDITLELILDILCKIYRGEESLCNQFWDRDSITDGPIRCLLCNLEGEFPIRTVKLIRFLSALCEGTWPAECVYNFLDKSVGISTLFEISSDSMVDNMSQIVETQLPLHVPGFEGLLIPSKTHGHILRMIDGDTALVRWEYAQSGVFVLVLRLAKELYVDSNEEVIGILDLLCRLISSNMAVCFALLDMGNSMHVHATHVNRNIEKNVWCRVNIIEIICTLIRNLSPNRSNALLMSMGISIFAKMLKCSPSHVSAVALKANVFNVGSKINIIELGYSGSSSESWLLSGRLAKLLLIDSEKNDTCIPLTISVLDFTMQLVETGLENDAVLALVVFSLQYILVNHEYWKYKVKHVRWEVTLKALKLMEKCIISLPYSQKLGEVIQDILLCDSSIHSTLFRVICITPQALEKLYVSRLYEPMEIEGLELAICSVLDTLFTMLSNLSKDISSSLPVFHQAVLSSTTKPYPVVAAVIALMSYFRNTSIQVKATRLLSMLFIKADYWQSHLLLNVGFGLNDKQIADLRNSVNKILFEQSLLNEDLCVAIIAMLTSATLYQPAFLVAVIAAKENTDLQLGNAGAKKASLINAILGYVERSDDLIKSDPCVLLNVLNFLKALWQGAAQYTDILEQLKGSGKFWKQLSNSVSLVASMEAPPRENDVDMEALSWAYRFRCQSVILELMAYDTFLQEKLLHAELLVKQAAESSKDRIENAVSTEKSKASTDRDLKDILSSWSESSFFGDLIKSFSSCEYDNDIHIRAKVAASLLTVHVMGKLAAGDAGSLSVSLSEKFRVMANELSNLPAFSELLAQYSQRGYSEGKELNTLIISDLYYHLQGDLEGRKIDHGPFKELSQFLLESKLLKTYQPKYDGDLFAPAKDVYLFDTVRLRADLGLDMWDHSEWKGSKAIADMMLLCMEDSNSMLLLATSKLSALRALITVLAVSNKHSTSEKTTLVRGISDQLILSCLDHTCLCFRSSLESVAPALDASEIILDFLAAQAELMLYLCRSVKRSLSLPVCVLMLKTSGVGLRVLSDFRPSVAGVKSIMKFLLLLLLSSVESICQNSGIGEATNIEPVENLAEVSNVCLGLLPILCNCIEITEYCTLSLTAMDSILRSFLTPSTWFPIIQKHLHFQHLVGKLQDKDSPASIPIILKFLLTLARVKGGAEILLATGFFSSLRALLADLSDNKPFPSRIERSIPNTSDNFEKPEHIWGLGLAVVTAIISSLGDSSSCVDIVDDVISYFFSEKAYVISYYLNAPDYPSDNHEKKRARAQRTVTSLLALKETEHTLMLMCEMVKHWNSWVKAMKDMDSELREKSIHLLAFISRGTQRLGESPSRNAPLLCPPVLKEEIRYESRPSFVKSRNGWFALSPLGAASKTKLSASSSKSPALLIKDSTNDHIDPASPTYFSDSIALQIYRIAFLILKFLCLQAEGAAKRAEEVGFVDLAHFPELPMPEILHGLQDQAIAIVTELCEANKSKQMHPQVQDLCILLLQIMEMALYLELCVSQICGIRPVLGRVEDFSKEAKLLIKALHGHVFLNAWVKSLKQIISLVYPSLLHSEGFL